MASCTQLDDGQPPSAYILIEGYIGGAWVELHRESVTPPTMPTGYGDSNSQLYSGSATFTASLTCEIRATLYFLAVAWTPSNTGTKLTATANFTDFRYTSTDTLAACTGSGGTGGDGDTPPGGDTGGCTCDWSAGSGCSTSWSAGSAPTTTWTKEDC